MSERTHTARPEDEGPTPVPERTQDPHPRDETVVPYPADRALAHAAASGDRDAREEVIRRLSCIPRMLAAINRRSGSALREQELQDVAQDTLALVWRKLANYAGLATLETWSFRFCALELRNAARRMRRSEPAGEPSREAAPNVREAAPFEPLDFESLYAALDRIPTAEASVVRLKHFEQLTFEAIGARLAISPNTAKTTYYRAIDRLRERLAPRFGEPR